jgi:hypothetical protein
LALELENAHTSLAATRDKLDSKSQALDFQVIRADEAMLRLKNVESRLKAAEVDLKNQRQLLESAQKTSSKHESSFSMMIFSAVEHAAVLFKNHLPGLTWSFYAKTSLWMMRSVRPYSPVYLMLLKTVYLHMILLVLTSPMTMTAQGFVTFFFCMLDELLVY